MNDSQYSSEPFHPGRKLMVTPIIRFIGDESGATAIEYALISSLIAIVIIGVLSNIGTSITNVFTEIGNNLK
jgi:pilus assembly protein Flp/PilA